MAQRPDPSRDTIQALEALQNAASEAPPPPALPRGSAPPEPPPIELEPIDTPAAAPVRAVQSRAATSRSHSSSGAPPYRCLSCGYAMLADSDFRCTECGVQFEERAIREFFDGDQRDPLTRIIWLVHASLVLKLYMLPAVVGIDLGGFAGAMSFANALVVIGVCYMAGRDRADSIGGYYAIAGTAAGFLGLLGLFRGFCMAIAEPILFGLDAVAGCLLLLAILTRPDGVELWRGRTTRRIALTATIAIPPVIAVAYGIESALGGATAIAALQFVNSGTLGALVSLGTWLWVRQWLVGFRRNVLDAPADFND